MPLAKKRKSKASRLPGTEATTEADAAAGIRADAEETSTANAELISDAAALHADTAPECHGAPMETIIEHVCRRCGTRQPVGIVPEDPAAPHVPRLPARTL